MTKKLGELTRQEFDDECLRLREQLKQLMKPNKKGKVRKE